MKTFVYFAQRHSDNAIKIGVSGRIPYRMQDLRNKYGKLTLLHLIEGMQKDERALHSKFSHLRLDGEWFKPESELTEFISNL